MAKEYSIRETVTTLVVTKQLQKISFQIRHPESVKEIISIAVTCSLVPDHEGSTGGGSTGGDGPPAGGGSTGGGTGGSTGGHDVPSVAGYLSLAIPQKGDVVFGEDVRLDNNDFSDLFEKTITSVTTTFSDRKIFDPYFKTCIQVDSPLLDGFYEDTFSPSLTNPDSSPKPFLYKVKIYLRYKRTEESKKNDC